jgi:hypothetical protein
MMPAREAAAQDHTGQPLLSVVTAAKLKNHHAFVIRSPMIDTRGSILAAGIQHASWNAAQNLNIWVSHLGVFRWTTQMVVKMVVRPP